MLTSTPSFDRTVSFSGGPDVAIAANRPIRVERRLNFRYPLDLSVRYRSFAEGSLLCGVGRTVDVSSGGVLVVSQHSISQQEISMGALVELSIEWPSLLDGRIPLQLFAVGRVVRSRAFIFAATLERYQFRTMKSSNRSLDREAMLLTNLSLDRR